MQTYRPAAGRPQPLPGPPPELRSPLVRQSLGYEEPGNFHDGTGWLVLAFTFCVLCVGWAGFLQPRWRPGIILSGGNDSAQLNADESPMIDVAPVTEPPATQPEEVPPVETVAPTEEIPEPVPVVSTADAFTVPAPPEIVQALKVTDPKPDRPRPPAPSKPASAPGPAKPAGPPATAAGSAAGSGAGSGTGQGAGSGKKARTSQPPYPGFARTGRMTGTVVVSIVVDDSGAVISANVVRSCGFPQLDSYTSSYILGHWKWPEGGRRTFTQPVSYRLR